MTTFLLNAKNHRLCAVFRIRRSFQHYGFLLTLLCLSLCFAPSVSAADGSLASPSDNCGWLTVFAAVTVLAVTGLIFRLHIYYKQKTGRSLTDPLTGLGNRQMFEKEFDDIITDKNRDSYAAAYIALDTDSILRYNSSEELKKVLIAASDALKSCCRGNEFCARMKTGDYAAVFSCVSDGDIEYFRDRFNMRFDDKLSEYKTSVHPHFHIGFYRLDGGGDCETALFHCVQTCTAAKEKNVGFLVCDEKMRRNNNEEKVLQHQIKRALETRQFVPYAQQMVDGDGNMRAAEIVARWKHPNYGILLPGRFVPMMEREKNVGELDFYMFEETCILLAKRKAAGKTGIMLTCNFSRNSISAKNFGARISGISDKYDFIRHDLIVEITESVIEDDIVNVRNNVGIIKELGFRLALDDVGSGFTSFSDLITYDVDFIKLDRVILLGAENGNVKLVAKAVVNLAHEIGADVVGEGAQTKEQVDLLLEIGCDLIQGYYFSYPLPPEESGIL